MRWVEAKASMELQLSVDGKEQKFFMYGGLSSAVDVKFVDTVISLNSHQPIHLLHSIKSILCYEEEELSFINELK